MRIVANMQKDEGEKGRRGDGAKRRKVHLGIVS